MKARFLRKSTFALLGAGSLLGTVLASQAHAVAASPPTYNVVNVGAFGGEPWIVSDGNGVLYDNTPSGGTILYRSTDNGQTWTQTTTADTSSGDDCLGSDQSNAIYMCNLAGSQSTGPLQGDVWKSTNQGNSWVYGNNPINQHGSGNLCGTSCSPFGVDRDWVDGYIPAGGTTATAEVVLMYHDFYGPSQIWVNISHDGGQTYGTASDILLNLNTAGALGGVVAQADSACNTVPVGLRIAKSGPHPGRIFAAWLAADPSSVGTGCNLSMAQAFHNLIVAWSDDNGLTWIPQVAFDAGPTHDASSPFAGFALDNQGNPYFGFANNLNWTPTCAGPTNPQTANCEFDMYVVWSPDGGATWKGGAGLVPGSAGTPYKVNSGTGTHFFPWITAGDPGKVDVAYLETPNIIPTDPSGKEHPGSCFPTPPATTCTSTAPWNVFAGQSLNLNATPESSATWADSQITTTAMHLGDICNLGIACVPGVSNRNILDYISVAVDPQGCAHVAYADDNTVNLLRAANQVTGPGLFGSGTCGPGSNIPESIWPVLLLPAGAAAAALGLRLVGRRRGKRNIAPVG